MKKKNKNDVLEIMSQFQLGVLKNKPSVKQMYDDVRMMGYKIKPVHGDVSDINLQNTRFIELLWSLGKLDEFFQKHIETLPSEEKDIFHKIFDTMYRNFQEELNTINLKPEKVIESTASFEMEIYKDKSLKSN